MLLSFFFCVAAKCMCYLQLPDKWAKSGSCWSDPPTRQHGTGCDTGISVVMLTDTVTDFCRWRSEVNEWSQDLQDGCFILARNFQEQTQWLLANRRYIWLQLFIFFVEFKVLKAAVVTQLCQQRAEMVTDTNTTSVCACHHFSQHKKCLQELM